VSSIPLPALDVRAPQPQQNPMGQYAQLLQLQNEQQLQPLRVQQAQQSVQSGGLQLQQQQQDLKDQQGISKWFMNIDPKDPNAFDPMEVGKTLANAGVSGKGIMQAQQQLLQHQQTVLTMNKDQIANQQEMSNNLYDSINGVIGVTDPQQRAQLLTPLIQNAVQAKALQPQQAMQMLQNPSAITDDQLKQMQHGLGVSSAFLASVARKQQADTEQGKITASMNPQSSLYAPSPAAVAMGTAPGAAAIQAGEAQQAGQKAAAEGAARQPFEMRLAQQRQALSQGDPKAAAQLLIDGDATLSELKARGSSPEFIANTLAAAHQMSGGKYNAQQSEAQFDVAKSPANVAFFGSAKSLTDKGGTLDQLAQAAKDIPGNQIPVFNTIADAEKAATGSGPLAKYASLLLGVSDDYSKVMGGGQGSDTSRSQALRLVPTNASPEARAAAIEGIRGAVNSQMNSRIGKNPVLGRMYGSPASTSNPNDPFAQFGGKAHP
jgi:hypothetical protein